MTLSTRAYHGALSLRTTMSTTSALQVDREHGVIRNVPVITSGTTKPPGSGGPPFFVDGVTLQQVAEAINTSPTGVNSRLTHAELEGVDPIRAIVGKWRNARVVDGRVLADFHLLTFAQHSPMCNAWEFLLSLAEQAPDAAGVSIYSNDAWLDQAENVPTGTVLRIGQLKAIDWVGEPAANPSGMLSAATGSTSTGVTDGAGATAAVPQGSSMYTDAQMEYLRELGLAPDASADVVAEFVAKLSPEQLAQFKAAGSAPAEGEEAMAADQAAAPAPAPASATPVPAAAAASARSAAVANLSYLNDLAKLAGLGAEWAVEMALSGKTPDQARKIALAAKAKEKAPVTLRGSSETVVGQIGADRNLASLNAAVRDAIMLRAGLQLYNFIDSDVPGRLAGRIAMSAGRPEARNPHDRVREFAGLDVLNMARKYLCMLGYRKADQMYRADLARLILNRNLYRDTLRDAGIALAHSTSDYPYLLADVMGKSLRQSYDTAQPTWPVWCRRATAPDFKQIKKLQLSEAPSLSALAEGEEYSFGTMTESREVYSLGTYGRGVVLTRQALINDDLDAFGRIPTMFGRAAARLEETTAIGILTANAAMADSNALFSTAHANLTTGALSVTSLGAARAAMRKQVPLGGDSSNPLELTPKALLVPEELSVVAEQLVGSTVDPAKNNSTPNLAFVRNLVVVPSARLSGSSQTIFYLLADYNEIDTVEMSFLEGEEGPVIEEDDDFNTDARKIKIRHNVAAKAIDWRGMVRSSGA